MISTHRQILGMTTEASKMPKVSPRFTIEVIRKRIRGVHMLTMMHYTN